MCVNLIIKIFYFQQTQEDQGKVVDCVLSEKCGDMGDIPKIKMITKKLLKGHINKVNSVHYADDSRYHTNFINSFLK